MMTCSAQTMKVDLQSDRMVEPDNEVDLIDSKVPNSNLVAKTNHPLISFLSTETLNTRLLLG